MENFASILERDYGFKSGKNAPMASSSSGGSGGGGSYGLRKTVPASRMSANASTFQQEDPFGVGRKNEGSKSLRSTYGSRDDLFSHAAYDDVFGGPPKGGEPGARYDDVFGGSSQGAPVFDDLLGGYGGSTPKVKSASGSFHSSPRRSDRNHFVAPDPVYDELLPGFGFLPKSRSSAEIKATHDPDPFVPLGHDPPVSSSATGSSALGDGLLPGFESTKTRSSTLDAKAARQTDPFVPLFDDSIPSSIPATSSPFVDDGLLPGFSTEGVKSRSFREAKVTPVQDSFVSLGDDPISSSIPSASPPFDDDPLNIFSEPQRPSSASSARAPVNGVKAERFEAFDNFPDSPRNSGFFKDSSRKPAEDAGWTSRTGSGTAEEAGSAREGFSSDNISEVSADPDPFFPVQTELGKSAPGSGSSDKLGDEMPAWNFISPGDQQIDRGSSGNTRLKELKEVWLTLDDMKLLTQPSAVPPPSRRPPPLPGSKADSEFVTSSSSTSPPDEDQTARSSIPPLYEQAVPGWMDFKIQSSRDEEKEREEARAARERRKQEKEESQAARESRNKEMKEREARQARELERLRRDKEREKDRAAVRVATLEARERAAQEAREKAERSAVERVTGEARERAASQARARVERAAVERASAEARERAEVRAAVERAASEARERAERAAAEKAAVERAAAEARERAVRTAAERAAVERAQSEARERAARVAAEKAAVERAAGEARERAERVAAEKAAASRDRSSQMQRKSENDLESFFGRSASPASTDLKQRPVSMNNSNVFGESRRSSGGTATTAASVDDWASILGSASISDDFQDNRGGDSARSSRARVERMQHTRDRAAKAIAEINQRDLETQREQAEKQRAGDVLDAEIKRWAAGKEGNLRALLSTLQYVLWPECGWTPVSLTDLINPAQVKKTYKKATLCVHPDKVQQKGATVQQKYIAEKVFDLLKEASNKFNSEELF